MTVDKYGPSATIITGEIGKLYGQSSIINSPYVTNRQGVGTHLGNPIIGHRRLIRMRTEDVIQNDQRRFVLSERLDFTVQYGDALVELYAMDAPGSGS